MKQELGCFRGRDFDCLDLVNEGGNLSLRNSGRCSVLRVVEDKLGHGDVSLPVLVDGGDDDVEDAGDVLEAGDEC